MYLDSIKKVLRKIRIMIAEESFASAQGETIKNYQSAQINRILAGNVSESRGVSI